MMADHIDNSLLTKTNTRFDINLFLKNSGNFDYSDELQKDLDFASKYIKSDEVMVSKYFHIDDILNNFFSFEKMEKTLGQRVSSIPKDHFEIRLKNDFKHIESIFKDESQRSKFRTFTSLFIPRNQRTFIIQHCN